MSNVKEVIHSRYSVRDFEPRLIEPEKLKDILEAAHVAPSAVNKQPVRVYVFKSEKALEKLRKLTPMLYNAPECLLIGYDSNVSAKGEALGEPDLDMGVQDACIAADEMMLQAWDLGIGSVWVRGFNKNQISQAFDLPQSFVPVCLLPIGYPAKSSKPSAMHFSKIYLESMVKTI